MDNLSGQCNAEGKIAIVIGRLHGPLTDSKVGAWFTPDQVSVIRDTLALVNKVTNEAERWYFETPNGRKNVPFVGEENNVPDPTGPATSPN